MQAERLAAALAGLFWLLAAAGAGAQPGGGFEQRRNTLLEGVAAAPWPDPNCPEKTGDGACIWSKTMLAIVRLFRTNAGLRAEDGMALLGQVAHQIHRALGRAEGGNALDLDEAPEALASRRFHFLTATLLFRAARQFGPDNRKATVRLPAAAEHDIREVFWAWAKDKCRLADADPAMVWRPWGSENHDIQHVHTCWATAELLQGTTETRDHHYQDGSTVAAQQAAWTAYSKAFIRARAEAGLTVETFSPTYSKYFLNVFYNLFDFASDAELRRLAGNFITLWWALWAEEQTGGVFGGARTRAYIGKIQDPTGPMPWLYAALGGWSQGALHPAWLPMLVSGYRPPEIVLDIMRNPVAAGGTEVWTRQLGLAAGPPVARRYVLSPDLGGLTRYTYTTSDYAMGALLTARLPAAAWTAISSQNRWNGMVMADGPEARVYAQPLPQSGRSTYNAVIATQSHGTQIVQRLPPPFSRRAGDMEIVVGRGLGREERGGWIFAEGSAFAAVRPAFGGYLAGTRRIGYRLLDQRAPVIIQAGSRAAYPSFAAFQAAVLAASLQVTSDSIEFQGLNGAGRLRVFLNGELPAERDGRPIQAPEGWTLYSPFIRQRQGERVVSLAKGERLVTLGFDAETEH